MRIDERGGRRYLQVVGSCGNRAGKPRHNVVANLMRLAAKDGSQRDALIRGLGRAIVRAVTWLHGDDTTVPLLARGGTKTARLWPHVRDGEPSRRH